MKMTRKNFTPLRWLAVAALLAGGSQVLNCHAAGNVSAMRLAHAEQTPLVAVTHAGDNLVAVGDHGIVVRMDGRNWRQAATVPVDTLLTAVTFVDAQNGWAVGHGGVLLHTRDGGENWTLQQRLEGEPVLLSVWFGDTRHGIVTGAYGYASETHDGGQSWQRLNVSADGDDYHLNQIFPGPQGSLFIAAEKGTAYRSRDNGSSWESLDTGASGSLWSGTVLRDERVVLVGMSGRVLVSADNGDSWHEVDSHSRESITAVTQLKDGRVALVGNGGLVSIANAGTQRFHTEIRTDRQNLAALASADDGSLMVFGAVGVATQDLVSFK
ncbi:YCF48-related protein [Pseudomonas sp. GD03860]|uniref:WD40/YVTN/BNR-like repeat-containing protein n=1 Tax=Pseudomonas TaxID=286 RepID=UPI0023632C95|nr:MULTISPECIES: YCF48-related protein [Pseudomonas]MDD2058456.1 YCF48-related protein [Pseudomonas putida]MDH0640442.1 YCF48-related protein [Pseudomonas sp. GD03860]